MLAIGLHAVLNIDQVHTPIITASHRVTLAAASYSNSVVSDALAKKQAAFSNSKNVNGQLFNSIFFINKYATPFFRC